MGRVRAVATGVTGVALAIVVVSVTDYLAPRALGISAADPALAADPVALRDFMSRQPTALYVLLAVGHFLGALVAGLIAGLGGLGRGAAVGVGVVAAAAAGLVLAVTPGLPAWFAWLALPAYVPGAVLGHRWVALTRAEVRRRAARAGGGR